MFEFEIFFNVIAPLGLFLVMFGMGVSLHVEDFKRLAINPKAAVLGIFGQLIGLPLLAFAITQLLSLPPEIAMGVIILSACPGGAPSNAFVFLARADTTLSVSLTAFNSIVTVFSIPLIVGIGLQLFMGENTGIEINALEMVVKLSFFCVVPVVSGMIVCHFFPNFSIRSEGFFKYLSAFVLLFLLAAVLISQKEFLLNNLQKTWFVVVVLCLSSIFMAYCLCRLFSLGIKQTVTIIIEVGMQNNNLAILIATTLLLDIRMAIVPSIYGVFSFLLMGLFVFVVSRRSFQ